MRKKTEFRFFIISEWEKEEVYLRKMHRKGWRLVSVSTPGIYRFEECEPEDVVYRLDYNKEAESEEEEYRQLFADCGWEYVLKYVGYSYFRKKATDREDAQEDEIFGDDASKLEMCQRVFRSKMLPLFAIFGLVLLPQLVLHIAKLWDGSTGEAAITVMIGLISALYIWVFVTFLYRYQKVKSQKR